jgi:hypothetical protein
MQLFSAMRTSILILSIGLCLQGQNAPTKGEQTEIKGIPPRATPGDYSSHAQAGAVTIAAEYTGHSLPTSEGPLTTDEFVGVEAALFGPGGEHLKIFPADFSLRVNGKKTPLPSEPYGLILTSLKDPQWTPPEAPAGKSKSGLSTGDQGQSDNAPPAPVKIPVPVQRAMAKRIQQAALPEGDRSLPQAGLLFFRYRGKAKNVHSAELLYDGPAGKATLQLHP